MRLRVYFLLVLLCSTAAIFGSGTKRFTVIKNPYLLSTYFEMIGKKDYEGRAIKETLKIHTEYDLYDAYGDYEGQGVCRIMSLGFLFACAREIDVYDACQAKIGMIDGKVFTTARERYDIYDAQDRLIGIAYNNRDASSFSIVDPTRNERLIGNIKRKILDEWQVTLYDCETIDMRILKIFAAFIVDYQEHF